MVHLRSLLDRRKKELDNLEKSATVTQGERTRLQLHSSAVSVEIVSLRQELEDSRAATASVRVSEEAGRLQLARMMDDQLAHNQTIENLRRQVESSNTAVREAQAALRLNQDQQLQQQRMPPPTTYLTGTGGVIGNTPFVPSFSTPLTGMRTRELHGPGYYHVGSPADPGYAEQMRAMYGREEADPPRQDPPRQDPISYGSSSRGSSSQATSSTGWHSRPGQRIPAFPSSRIVPSRRIDTNQTAYQLVLKFASSRAPKLTKKTLMNTVHPSVTVPGSFR